MDTFLVMCKGIRNDGPDLDGWESKMPTVLQVGRYRFYFFSNERQEPPHIHIKAGSDQAKFWLAPIGLASNYGFRAYELNEMIGIIEQHREILMEAWNEYFGEK